MSAQFQPAVPDKAIELRPLTPVESYFAQLLGQYLGAPRYKLHSAKFVVTHQFEDGSLANASVALRDDRLEFEEQMQGCRPSPRHADAATMSHELRIRELEDRLTRSND